ncbi:unnamed protein product [Linum tenue]|uniref:non-specific serine/threonine protein kinase n=1 Tax=Linum tenue TaxID=586396 RepID=A0AAV0S514_9ROSI|nr:unnamed protein product [Linum tenue]
MLLIQHCLFLLSTAAAALAAASGSYYSNDERDAAALLQLKTHIISATSSSDHPLSRNWTAAATAQVCSSWVGVSCGHRHRRVTSLNLANMGLQGTLPPHIGNLPPTFGSHLPNLEWLSFAGNNLNGSIPPSISNASNLELLELSINSFSGCVPNTFGNLQMLQSLYIWGNSNLVVDPSFLTSLTSCKSLKILEISDTSFEGALPPSMGNLSSSFQYFLGSNCKIQGNIPVTIRRRKKSSEERNKVKEELLASLTWRRISLLELQRATNGFDDCNLLGKGSFGRVYKGVLADDTNVAIKVFSELEGEADDDDDDIFGNDTECEVLRNLRHRNLIKIISTCYTTGFKALVLEFMPNGSLHKWLYSHNYFLDIFKRLDILIDVASALEYLHQGYSIPVVHCDLKPSNVLLDGDLVAHIADFGISKFLGSGDSMTRTLTLATIGYMAPEFGMDGIVSTKSDVYSFGILVMEVFTRRNPTEESFQEGMSMKQWVTTLVPEGVTKYADANLLNCNSNRDFKSRESCISSIMKLALECCADTPRDRLAINDVLANLRKIKSQLQQDLCRRA